VEGLRAQLQQQAAKVKELVVVAKAFSVHMAEGSMQTSRKLPNGKEVSLVTRPLSFQTKLIYPLRIAILGKLLWNPWRRAVCFVTLVPQPGACTLLWFAGER
jgi:hypothetical protein